MDSWAGSFVFNPERGRTEQDGGSPKKDTAGSFVFNPERGRTGQDGGSPKKDTAGSFVFNREAAAKQQQQEGAGDTKEESPKLWRPGTAQQSEPDTATGRTKEDLYKLYETMGSSAAEISLKDLVEKPKKPVRKGSQFKPPVGSKIPEGRPAATGAGSGGRKSNNQRHHRPEFPSKPKVTVPPRANGSQTPEKNRRSFGEMLHEVDPKNGGKQADTLPRSRSAQAPETSPRAHYRTISPRPEPRIVIPETSAQPQKSPKRATNTKSPRGALVKSTSGNEAPLRSARQSPGPSPLSSPRPRRGSLVPSASSPARLGNARGPWPVDVQRASSPRGGQNTFDPFPFGSATPRVSFDQPRSPLAPIASPGRLGSISSPARHGYEQEQWSIDLLHQVSSPRGGNAPWATPRRSAAGHPRSPLSRSSPARLGYEREPWSSEELPKGQRRRSNSSPWAEQMYSSAALDKRSASYSNRTSTEDEKSHNSLGDLFGNQINAAPPFQNVHQTLNCSRCSSYTLMRTRCLVCGKIYCRSCVKDAMGDMPEGRKCTDTCVGRPLHRKYKNKAGTGCFWIPRASKIVELKLVRQQASKSTSSGTSSNSSTFGKHSTYPHYRSTKKTHAKHSNRTNNQNIPPRMSISSHS